MSRRILLGQVYNPTIYFNIGAIFLNIIIFIQTSVKTILGYIFNSIEKLTIAQ